MSYRIDISFKNCKEKDIYKNLEEFSELVEKNRFEILKNNFWYIPFWRLEKVWEKTKDKWEVEEAIRKWIAQVFKYHFYYSRELQSLCIVYSCDKDDEISKWFNGYVYFQNSCDQDYDYETWDFNKKFKEYVEQVKLLEGNDDAFKKLYKELNDDDFDWCEESRKVTDYDRRSLVYDMCYKQVESLWETPMKICVGENIFGEYYDESKFVIRLLCGLEKFKDSDKDYLQNRFKFWKKVFELEK